MAESFEDFYGKTICGMKVGSIARRDKHTRRPLWFVSCSVCGTTGQVCSHADLKYHKVNCANAGCGRKIETPKATVAGTSATEQTTSRRNDHGELEPEPPTPKKTNKEIVQGWLRNNTDFYASPNNIQKIVDYFKENKGLEVTESNLTQCFIHLKLQGHFEQPR